MLTAVLSAQDRQTLSHRRPDHERVRGTESVLVRLSQRELLKVQPQLAHVGLLLDRDLTRVRAVLSTRVRRVHEHRLVLVRDPAARELKGATGAEAVGTRTDGRARPPGALGVRETGARVAVVAVAGSVLESDNVQDPCSGQGSLLET